MQQDVIAAATKSPYGFYSVIDVVSKKHLQVQEIYTGQARWVKGLKTTSYAKGNVLFAAVPSVNSLSVLLGNLPQPLTTSARVKIEAHREKWRAEEGKAIDNCLLYLQVTELRRFYFMQLNQLQRTQLH